MQENLATNYTNYHENISGNSCNWWQNISSTANILQNLSLRNFASSFAVFAVKKVNRKDRKVSQRIRKEISSGFKYFHIC
jgi:hypothetical protein